MRLQPFGAWARPRLGSRLPNYRQHYLSFVKDVADYLSPFEWVHRARSTKFLIIVESDLSARDGQPIDPTTIFKARKISHSGASIAQLCGPQIRALHPEVWSVSVCSLPSLPTRRRKNPMRESATRTDRMTSKACEDSSMYLLEGLVSPQFSGAVGEDE